MATIGIAFRRFWQSETGPRTVHFWAPTLKWGLVIAGISDMKRSVENLSGAQNLSLLATATIWMRWSFVILPKNYLLATINCFLASTAGYQIFRITDYRIRSGDSMSQAFKYIISGPDSTDSPKKLITTTTSTNRKEALA